MDKEDNVGRVLCHCVACKGKVLVPEWKTTLHLARGEWNGECENVPIGLEANQEALNIVDMEEEVAEAECEPPDLDKILDLPKYLPFYPGARCSKISAIMHIFNLQDDCNWSNVDVDKLFRVLNEVLLPFNNCLPQNRNEAKKFLDHIGGSDLSMKKYHACLNDCCLYYDDFEFDEECPNYGTSRWKDQRRKIPWKSLIYFPIIPRIVEMYGNLSKASLLRWNDGVERDGNTCESVQHSDAWKYTTQKLGLLPHDIRFGLSLDGFQPFSKNASDWSIWAVTLINYNYPPWLYNEPSLMFLSLLIPGRRQVAFSNVYVKPLIDDMNVLWRGRMMYDVSRSGPEKTIFVRGIILWTLHDLVGYGFIAGCTIHGYTACVICGPETGARYSKALNKLVYCNHRRWLRDDRHPYRSMKEAFDGDEEYKSEPKGISCNEWIIWATDREDYQRAKYNYRFDPAEITGIKFLSVIYELPYFKDLPIRHIIDVMHVEKNCCAILLDFLFGWKDTYKVRDDLKEIGVRQELHIQTVVRADGSQSLRKPAAPYVLTRENKKQVRECFQKLRIPTKYGSSFKKPFQDDHLHGLKSHDYHLLLQVFLPIILRGRLPRLQYEAISKLSKLFQILCAKEFQKDEEDDIKKFASETMCELEMAFPPAMFTISFHLVIHLAPEMFLCGPVHSRWMYPTERYLKVLKGMVKNRTHPEANIAEQYTIFERLEAHINKNIEFEQWPASWESLDKRLQGVTPEGAMKYVILDSRTRKLANDFILFNSSELSTLLSSYSISSTERHVARSYGGNLCSNFKTWLHKPEIRQHLSTTARELSDSCLKYAKSYQRMWVNGTHYRTEEADEGKVTFDCGIMHKFEQDSIASASDRRPIMSYLDYVGRLQTILELDFGRTKRMVFQVKWFNRREHGNNPTIKYEESPIGKIMLIKSTAMSTLPPTNDPPFIYPEQAIQIFFIEASEDPTWWIVCRGDRNYK